MSRLWVIFAAVLLAILPANDLGSPAFAELIVLDFDELPSETWLSQDEYASLGVIFTSAAGGDARVWNRSTVSVLDDPNGGAFSLPNAIAGAAPASIGIVATFVDPVTGLPATASFVEVGVSSGPGPDPLSDNVELLAFDSTGTLIASDPADTSLQFDILSVSSLGIARVEMVAGSRLDIFDDFVFRTATTEVFTNRADFLAEITVTEVIDFEDQAFTPVQITGSEYASQGVVFRSPFTEAPWNELWIEPGRFFHDSNFLSVDMPPFMPPRNHDDLIFDFVVPVRAFGVDLVDNANNPGEAITVYGAGGLVIYSQSLILGDFWGIVADEEIVSIFFDEHPDDGDDIGWDNVTIGTSITNTSPVARCKDVWPILADGSCLADADIDDGSFDPDGDPITLAQSPPESYGLGATVVTLTVTDDSGASDSCTGTVTVIDRQSPIVSCNAPMTITPPDAPISFTATAEDNCDDVLYASVIDYDCYWYNPAEKRVDKTGSCVVGLEGDTLTVYDTGGVNDNIEWLVSSTDTSGNSIVMTCATQVVNPAQ